MAIAIVTLGLIAWTTPTREQRAIANLVNAGAHVVLFEEPEGNRFFDVDLHSCEGNDELLSYVADVENVQSIHLGAGPVCEAGMKALLRLKGLRCLDDASFPPEVLTQLERDLKRNNPNLEIGNPQIGRKAVEAK